MGDGRVVLGCLSPHPPHLIYALNPERNEPQATGAGAWQSLLEGYTSLQRRMKQEEIDVIVLHTPHWKTVVGHHLLGVPHFEGHSVDPVFPNLFRYRYELDVDVELSEAIAEEGQARSLEMTMMRNPDFRVDYGTLTSCHLVRPEWDIPVVVLSSCSAHHYFSNDVGDRELLALGEATRAAIERTGRRALVLASTSMSHRHFTEEPEDPEDPRFESIYNANQAAWDRRFLALMRDGRCAQVMAEMPDFIDQATSEFKEGGFAWLMGVLGVPDYPAHIHGYGTVIGTGNAIVEWSPARGPA